MSELQNRLKSLEPYLIQLRFAEGTPVVDMVFKKGWHVPQSEIIQSSKGDDPEVNYHMFYSTDESVEVDDIFNYIEKIIGLNIEREKKHELLKVKVKELQDLFRKTPLSELQNMRYVLGREELVKDMEPDEMDVVDFDIEPPVIERPTPKPQPEVVKQPQPEPVVEKKETVNEENVRRAPNGEIIPPLAPEDTGELDEDYQKFDLTSDEPTITKEVSGKKYDLPQKKSKSSVELVEIEGPSNIVCKCEPEEVCPACEEEKIGTY